MGLKTTAFNQYYYEDLKGFIKDITSREKSIVLWDNVKLPPAIDSDTAYVVAINCIGKVKDAQSFLSQIRSLINPQTKVIIIYYNYLWEPILNLAQFLKLKMTEPEQNWLTLDDIKNLLTLTHFAEIKRGERFLFPLFLPFISPFINRYLAKLPLISKLCLTNFIIARPKTVPKNQEYSVSIIVPARNEAGNIKHLINQVPALGKSLEVIFIEGHSIDNTWEIIRKLPQKQQNFTIKRFQQQGIGKADAVHLGVRYASGEVIIILDADLSVPAQEIAKFYDVLSDGLADFVNGSRLVYPQQKESMRFLNKLGNKFFSLAFTWILKERFTDTLCGTKAFFRKDYQKILKLRRFFGYFDPFGDFELIFGAAKLNLKVAEVPVHYKARTYGKSNISRFTHGWLLIKMCSFAFKKFILDS